MKLTVVNIFVFLLFQFNVNSLVFEINIHFLHAVLC